MWLFSRLCHLNGIAFSISLRLLTDLFLTFFLLSKSHFSLTNYVTMKVLVIRKTIGPTVTVIFNKQSNFKYLEIM